MSKDIMIGLRGGHVHDTIPYTDTLFHKRKEAFNSYRQSSTNDTSRDGCTDVDNIDPKNVPSISLPRSKSPSKANERTLKVQKTRKQRQSQHSSFDNKFDHGNGLLSKLQLVQSSQRRRGPSLSHFRIRRKFSAQELVASVKEAYHSRPSLNLSRLKVQEGTNKQQPPYDNPSTHSPRPERPRAESMKSELEAVTLWSPYHDMTEARPSEDDCAKGLGRSNLLRRISGRHHSRHRRLSRSIDETYAHIHSPLIATTESVSTSAEYV